MHKYKAPISCVLFTLTIYNIIFIHIWKNILNAKCTRFGVDDEDLGHIFWHCGNVWDSLKVHVAGPVSSNNKHMERGSGIFPIILWEIWEARNVQVFENKVVQPHQIVHKVLSIHTSIVRMRGVRTWIIRSMRLQDESRILLRKLFYGFHVIFLSFIISVVE